MNPRSHSGISPAPRAGLDSALQKPGNQPQQARHASGLSPDPQEETTLPTSVTRALAEIATQAWKARSKMCDPASGEVRGEMKRVYRHVESTLTALKEIGIEIKDHTGSEFNYGLPLIVITSQPTPGLSKEKVLETLKPTIFLNQRILQMGEVIIAVPMEHSPRP